MGINSIIPIDSVYWRPDVSVKFHHCLMALARFVYFLLKWFGSNESHAVSETLRFVS